VVVSVNGAVTAQRPPSRRWRSACFLEDAARVELAALNAGLADKAPRMSEEQPEPEPPGRGASPSAMWDYLNRRRSGVKDQSMEEDMNGISRKLMCGLIALLIASGAIAQPPRPRPSPHRVSGRLNGRSGGAGEGLFAKTGIDVRVTPTVNSVFQLTNLIDGKFDIAMTAIDNLIAYREGQGEDPLLGREFAGGDGRRYRVPAPCHRPRGELVRAMRGKTLSVDARTTGYAFVLIEMLGRAQL